MDKFLNWANAHLPGLPSAKNKRSISTLKSSSVNLECYQTWNGQIKHSKKNKEKGFCKELTIIQHVIFRVTYPKNNQEPKFENVTYESNKKSKEQNKGKKTCKQYIIKQWNIYNENSKKIQGKKIKYSL